MTVTANRSTPGAAGTVQWDDEGVVPETFPLVQAGKLVGFSTSRESAGWLQELHTASPLRSHGCASAATALHAPLVQTPNLVLQPGSGTDTFTSMIEGLDKGLVIKDANIRMDFQQLNGYGTGRTFEVVKGKRTAELFGAGVLPRTPEFWGGITQLGGASSVQRFGVVNVKGEPVQLGAHSVDVVPALIRDMPIIDVGRR